MDYQRVVIKHYVCALLVCMIAIFGLAFILANYSGFDASVTASVFPVVFAAVFAGKRYAEMTNRMPDRYELWFYARTFAHINLSIYAVTTVVFMAFGSYYGTFINGSAGTALFVLAAFFSWLIVALVSRYTFFLGVKAHLKLPER
ncbi:MAG: ABZJ_00895 family protein [Pseudomonadota bacterium]